jgi:dTDP-4-amino-4,6-dideoxygalactose transaminase/CelD/BcsL family acetyltransferase involved in cellulose biosynthesis
MRRSRVGVWPPLPIGAYTRRPGDEPPFPLDEEGCRLFARARHGLWHALPALGIEPGDEILVPAYHHGSEIEVLVRLGVLCRFYTGDEMLAPDEEELDSLLTPRVRALLVIHYLGFPQDPARWRQWCNDRGLLLIEDAAQAWLAASDGVPVGTLGDVSLFCLYKTFGLPDGAAVLSRLPPPPLEGRHALNAGALARRHMASVMARSRLLTTLAESLRRERRYDPEVDFALGEPNVLPSAATFFLLPRIADRRAAARRRANYSSLLEELGDRVSPPFAAVSPGASPFAFPLESDRPEKLIERLEEQSIGSFPLWSAFHPAAPADRIPEIAARRQRTVALPVHQELAPADVERIVAAVRKPIRRPTLRLEPIRSLDTAQEEWASLAERNGNIFATWEWASTWCRHFIPDGKLLTHACYASDDRLVAILPLYLSTRGPFRIVRFVGHGQADELGPICETADRVAVARALRKLLGQLEFNLFVAEHLPSDRGWGAWLGGKMLRQDASPVLRFGGRSWDQLLASWSANFRSQVRRRERKLAREHEVRFRLVVEPEELEGALDSLFQLHVARWQARGRWFGPQTERFHREFAPIALARGWLRFWLLEVDQQVVAAWYGFRFGGAESYYQAGRNPSWDRFSIGFVLLVHTIRSALEDGAREYRFLLGREPYKYRFATDEPGLETIALSRGVAADVALTAAAWLGHRPRVAALGRRIARD